MQYQCDGIIETDEHVSAFSFGLCRADFTTKQLGRSILHPLPLEEVMRVKHIYVLSIHDDAPLSESMKRRIHLAYDCHMGKPRLIPATKKLVLSREAEKVAKAMLKHVMETAEVVE